jgi:outer membrane protein assembly factor BamB
VAGNSVYVGSCNGLFRQLDASTGKVQWETNVRGSAPKYFFHGDVFTAADRIVASADVDPNSGAEAGVHAFDRGSGRQLWRHPAGRGVLGAVVGLGTRVFAYTAAGELIALSLDSGRREWSYDLKGGVWDSPAVVGERVFAGSSGGSVYAFDSATGKIDWQQELGAPISTSIRATESDVYAGTADGVMHRLATRDGRQKSSLKLDPALEPGSAPLVTRDALLVLLTDKQANYRALVSIDPALARVHWRRPAVDSWSTTRVFATSTAVVLGTPSGDVTAYCLSDGAVAWSQKLSTAPIRSVGGTDQMLFVGTPQGTLYAVRPPRSCM